MTKVVMGNYIIEMVTKKKFDGTLNFKDVNITDTGAKPEYKDLNLGEFISINYLVDVLKKDHSVNDVIVNKHVKKKLKQYGVGQELVERVED